MRLYALIFTLAVVHARAACVPIEAEKPQADEIIKHEENKEIVEQLNNADKVENNLRNIPENIPVAIVEDTKPAQEINENSNDYIPSDDEPSINIKRVEIDLKNPGPPQRQEHETQNPEFYAERNNLVADIRQKLLDTENNVKKSVSEVNEGFENWVPNTEHLTVIQKDIKEMQNKFLTQVSNLRLTLEGYLSPESIKSDTVDTEYVANLRDVRNRLKILEVNFKAGVETLSEGVKTLATAKADGEKPAETGSPNPAPANPSEPPTNPFSQMLLQLSNAIGDAFNGMQSAIQSITNPQNQTPPVGTQSDDAATPARPSMWEVWQSQFQSFINQFRPQVSPATNVAEAKPQNSQPAQAVSAPAQPVQPQPVQPLAAQSQAVQPESVQPQPESVQPQPVQPQPSQEAQSEPAEPPKETPASTAQTGPIRKIVENNPFVKGIVQRIQSISNPEKPRDNVPVQPPKSVKPEESVNEPISATKGHGGGGSQAGDNIDSGRIAMSVPSEEKVEKVPQKCEKDKDVELADEKKENEAVPDKTE
ncbi:unnamed protein product [Parnassius apollo]|uniref:(apollo) hypothetical protein n=1 Tax=Parnassius apollo TaxID=110799 RepID=A0A8S3XHJ8_PARAO|nr:unnamed protein product [Parnassius apollo]